MKKNTKKMLMKDNFDIDDEKEQNAKDDLDASVDKGKNENNG